MGIRDADALREILGIDGDQEVVSVIAVGYRDIDLPCRPGRAWRRLPVFIRMDGG